MDRDDPAYRGQVEYTPFFLTIYDPLILGVFTRLIWRCPTSRLVEGYRQNIRSEHLDVGPGTGYFLERAGLAAGSPVTLLDPNRHVLDHASRRLQRLDITTVEADVLKPLPIAGPFASAAMSGVIHFLPGPPSRKAAAVVNVAAVLAPTGVLFGSLDLGTTERQPAWHEACSAATTGGASSTTSATPRRGLARSSGHRSNGWSVETVGSMTIFAATHPRPRSSISTRPQG